MKNLLYVLLVFSLFACTRKSTQPIQSEPPTEPLVTPEEKPIEDFPSEAPPYLVAAITKSGCYGICPSFEARIFSNGHITYIGKKDVRLIGQYEAWVDLEILERIKEEARKTDFFKMSDVYPTNKKSIEDIPMTITYLNFDELEKTIINNYDSPKELRKFEAFLEVIFLEMEYRKIKSGS